VGTGVIALTILDGVLDRTLPPSAAVPCAQDLGRRTDSTFPDAEEALDTLVRTTTPRPPATAPGPPNPAPTHVGTRETVRPDERPPVRITPPDRLRLRWSSAA